LYRISLSRLDNYLSASEALCQTSQQSGIFAFPCGKWSQH